MDIDSIQRLSPWEDRRADSSEIVWRYSGNPIIPRNLTPTSNSIFNSAVVPFNGAFAGVFRGNFRKRHCVMSGLQFLLEPTL